MLAVFITGITPLGRVLGSSFLAPPQATRLLLPSDPKGLEKALTSALYQKNEFTRIISGGIEVVEFLLPVVGGKNFSSRAREAAIELIGEIFARLPQEDRDQILPIESITDHARISRRDSLEKIADRTTSALVGILRNNNDQENILRDAAVDALAQMQEFAEDAILAMSASKDTRMRDYCFEALGGVAFE